MKRKVLMLSTVGIAAGLVYALESNRRKQATAKRESPGDIESSANAIETEAHQLDDQGTNQAEAAHILKEIRDNAFDASNEKLALALGRLTEEIEQWTNGDGLIDGDVLMKARALAIQRGVEVE